MATTSPDPISLLPELLSAAQLSREARVSIGVVKDRLYSGEIQPDFRSGRTLLFSASKLPLLRSTLSRRL